MDSETVNLLKDKAKEIRKDIIQMLAEAGSGHPGGSLSAADIVTVLYFHEMRVDAQNPAWPERDRFVLSKGHAAPVLYAALAEKGFFPKEDLWTLRKIGSKLQGHPDMRKVPGVEISTGSLGQGLSAANGMALAGKMDGAGYRVYALLGDGECQEGQIWEAAMFAAHYHLDNLAVFLDHNGLQIDGKITDVMSPEPVDEKWRAFGWDVQVIDGHDVSRILAALDHARTVTGKPSMVIANTIKGKGVSFMEDVAGWHGVAPKREEAEKALAELAGE
ncbi:transketolase [Candidatus Formimonas warabiya]|uniref:Transketolase n=1 Tax=Formimonas warabiya TaxID=1761012 RepID=A0A3G1KTZ5_FORW1|nr:transketolase [Candidatus Formimonas warabiya]ATW25929.1 transketolase [Candidatus Formimonas warabiya]